MKVYGGMNVGKPQIEKKHKVKELGRTIVYSENLIVLHVMPLY